MKKHTLRFLSILMALCLSSSILASCKGNEEESSTKNPPVNTESASASDSDETEGTETDGTGADTETESGSEAESIRLEGDEAELIQLAYDLKNGVNPYYTDATRKEVTIDNKVMSLGYTIAPGNDNMQVAHLSNTRGVSYITDTMDVVLNLKNGKQFFASKSKDEAYLNIYRYGYYYYETRLEGQTFMNDIVAENEIVFQPAEYDRAVGVKRPEVVDGVLSFRMGSDDDPQIIYNCDFAAADYEYLEITMRLPKINGNTQIFLIAGSQTTFTSNQCYTFEPTASDEYVTYLIPLAKEFKDYTGTVRGIRIDLSVPATTPVDIKSIRVFKASYDGAPTGLSMQRSFLTYSTKLHHLVQLSTTETVEDVASVDIVTKIAADTVNKILLKDKNGEKNTLDGVDFASLEYVGFDIKNAGIFGFILPYDGAGGTIKVTLADGIYTVTQSKVPENNRLIPSKASTRNGSDFFMGMRVYNDENHDFAAFIKEAECERHPLTEKNITADKGYDGTKFDGYDSLRGYYQLSLKEGGDFNKSYYVQPNRQFRASFTVTGDEYDRIAYFSTFMDDNGGLECAVLLDEGDLILPVPIEVCKNFGGDGENTIYNLDDARYCQTFFPVVLNAGKTRSYSVAHLYQNWGRYPLKQISSIQFHTPFYHLSTGVTETNCIVPFAEAGPSLPDHRAMSAPFWPTQPQHTSGGSHVFLYYIDKDGKTQISNTTGASIDSYGPTYADIDLGYITADGKIEAKYTHMEMPQTDENRAYYEMSYTFLDDVSFNNFARDFKFYRCTDNDARGTYSKIGYLDENNQSKVVAADGNHEFVLGDQCPYFTYFDMANYSPDSSTAYGYVNISFLIYNSKIILNGEEITPNFYLFKSGEYLHLSLNLGEVTFKKGDTIQINAILMPWGSQELDYSGAEPDANVRRVRENTLLNPLKATADADCEVIDSVYLPKISTTNGESADFTLSGGHNNVTVRIYGFRELSVPLIEEYVDGRWVKYEISSADTPDGRGYGYEYDGYMVHYDGDGTYSYSFVTTIDNGAPRKFRISVVDNFKPWPKVPYEENSELSNEDDPINVYVDAAELAYLSLDILGSVSGAELAEDESYLRYFGNPGAGESYLKAFVADHPAYDDLETTGQYAVIKYRLPKNGPIKLENFQFFASTVNENPTGPEKFSFFGLEHDGEWHVLIIDLARLIPAAYYPANADGSYMAKFFRIDFFNQAGVPENMYIDFAYIALHDSLEEIYKLNESMDEVVVVKGERESEKIDPKTGNPVSAYTNDTELNLYFGAQEIYDKTVTDDYLFSSVKLLDDDGTYVRLNAGEGRNEGYKMLFDSTDTRFANITSTGKYFVIKYRLPAAQKPDDISSIQFYTYTVAGTSLSNDCRVSYEALEYDDKWHVLVIDITKMMPLTSYPATDGNYKALYLRMDFYNGTTTTDYYIDYAYVGFCDDLAKAYGFNQDMEEVLLVEGPGMITPIDPKSGEPLVKIFNQQVTFTNIYLNGERIGSDQKTNEPIVLGCSTYTLNTASSLSVTGRFFVEGGVKEYKYRVIGNTTATTSFGVGSGKEPGVADGDAYVSIAQGLGLTNSSLLGVTFNGEKVFDLSGFRGQTVTVEMIAVTNEDEEIVIARLVSVNVPQSDS